MMLFYSRDFNGDVVTLSDEEHQHCTKVLRKKVGETIFVTDGLGYIYTVKILDSTKATTIGKILSSSYKDSLHPRIAIAISPTKNVSRIEWFVEKATEIGISAIYLLHTRRTEKKSENTARMDKILISAMKQSLNVHLPTLQHITFDEFLKTMADEFEQKFIAYCNGPTELLSSVCKKSQSSLLLIGPEGDFTAEEVQQAIKSGCKEVSLGDSRLRTETAGIVGLMMLKY
ncbi:MAG: 16S rRNA (uracil(1498)-N(3))-methyltransferase [Saprospiraceae bacterium]|nr:16S rRNA (uracil(1498)-N(3))-methyltransferase [Saprospiraceae bacterium]